MFIGLYCLSKYSVHMSVLSIEVCPVYIGTVFIGMYYICGTVAIGRCYLHGYRLRNYDIQL